jgi:hypothetical protein
LKTFAGFVAFSVLVSHERPGLRLGHVGPLILGAYIAAMYTVFHYERRTLAETRRHGPLIPGVEGRSLSTAVRYAISALFVAAAGGVLPRVATEIAIQMGWSNTPARAVRLIEVAAGRKRRAAIEHADVVEAQEAALECVAPLGVLAVDPPS